VAEAVQSPAHLGRAREVLLPLAALKRLLERGFRLVKETGSIDDPTIIRRVLSIMEGGRDAFEKRNLRYELIPEAAEVSTAPVA
jgi:hypothetical protein